ncbi:hypothetical protein B0H12DRAFT_1071114 [Mycena haematopus]|nr:hypothetical protein B0H12DRAFT_1071114 [Mycena haematopus]
MALHQITNLRLCTGVTQSNSTALGFMSNGQELTEIQGKRRKLSKSVPKRKKTGCALSSANSKWDSVKSAVEEKGGLGVDRGRVKVVPAGCRGVQQYMRWRLEKNQSRPKMIRSLKRRWIRAEVFGDVWIEVVVEDKKRSDPRQSGSHAKTYREMYAARSAPKMGAQSTSNQSPAWSEMPEDSVKLVALTQTNVRYTKSGSRRHNGNLAGKYGLHARMARNMKATCSAGRTSTPHQINSISASAGETRNKP